MVNSLLLERLLTDPVGSRNGTISHAMLVVCRLCGIVIFGLVVLGLAAFGVVAFVGIVVHLVIIGVNRNAFGGVSRVWSSGSICVSVPSASDASVFSDSART